MTSVAFSPGGDRIVSGSYDQTVRVWDAHTGECLEIIEGQGDVAAIAVGAECRLPWRAFTRISETVIEPSGGGDPVARFPFPLRCFTTLPNGRVLAVGHGNHLDIITLEGEPDSANQSNP